MMSDRRHFLGAVANNTASLVACTGNMSAANRAQLTHYLLDGASGAIRLPAGHRHANGSTTAAFANCSEASCARQHSSLDGTAAWFTGSLAPLLVNAPRQSAAESLLSAYQASGPDCFSLIDGNYCAAIYDARLDVVRIASDLAASKPVFYALLPSQDRAQMVVFGSSAVEVLRCAGLPARVHTAKLQTYMANGTLAGDSETLLQGVQAVCRQHYLEISLSMPMQVRQVPFPARAPSAYTNSTAKERAEALRALLLRTVAAQSQSDATVVALSGGVDSSGILASLRHALGPAEPAQAYFYCQRKPPLPSAFNEQPWAEMAAARLDATLHAVEMDSNELPGMLSTVAGFQDFPFASPVILAQARLFQVASQSGAKVMLSGHGPDLIFGGGTSHLASRVSSLIRQGRLPSAIRMLGANTGLPPSSAARLFAGALIRSTGLRDHRPSARTTAPWMVDGWFMERIGPAIRHGATPVADSTLHDPLHAMIDTQLTSSPGSTSMLYEESNAAAFGLENRQPYLIASMLALSRSCPAELLVSETGQSKYILRLALRGLVPEQILQRRQRVGFAVPSLPWLLAQKQWVTRRYAELDTLPFFRGDNPHALWQQLQSGRTSAWHTANLVWKWLILLAWVQAHGIEFD